LNPERLGTSLAPAGGDRREAVFLFAAETSPMSAIGTKRTLLSRRLMSAFGGKADMPLCGKFERAVTLNVGIGVGITIFWRSKTTNIASPYRTIATPPLGTTLFSQIVASV
jgi:hypothetical protein